MANKNITSRDVDFAKWYDNVVSSAKLSKYSNVKGCIILEPNGYAIWEKIQQNLDKMFKESGHKNVAMPLLIPESLMKKEGELIEGFAPEAAWVTMGGNQTLEERMCIRPTSETVFSDYFSGAISSYRDLPLKYNQWCSVLRWEKETRPFLRSREFWWQEGHTIHETASEAEKETQDMLDTYARFFRDYLAIPVIGGRKTDKEKFAGAEYTLSIEALMYNGVSLQSGTSHYFGQKFSKAYDIKFLNRNNELEYAYQTSWGISTRLIGAVIMAHGDNRGLKLPPRVAPIQVVIVPIAAHKEGVTEKAQEVYQMLEENYRVKLDLRDNYSTGYKFNDWEMRGVPVRIEMGPRDIENGICVAVRRDTLEKQEIKLEELSSELGILLEDIQANMFAECKKRLEEKTTVATNMEESSALSLYTFSSQKYK